MQLFDKQIEELQTLLKNYQKRDLLITEDLLQDVGKNNMVFSNEQAYELGKDKSLSYELASSKYINQDKIILIGKDLNEIKENSSFIRITLLNVNNDELKGEDLYDRIEKIKFTKYRVSPIGYMLRTATGNNEKVRVSKDSAKYSFSTIGSAYIKAYHQLPFVNYVQEIFILDPDDNLFNQLKQIGDKKTEITNAIDHILKGMVANDCGACSVKDLCDEVQGMREIHKGK